MASVSIASTSTYEPVEIDVFGADYRTVPQTRSITQKGDEIEAKLEAASTPDELVAAIGDAVDLRVKPIEGTKKASTLIKERWKADEVTLDSLLRFLDDVRAADRPH
jgi:hypothetical protein